MNNIAYNYIRNIINKIMKINKGQFRLTSKSKNFKFDLKRGEGHLLSYAWNRIKWHFYPRLHYVSRFPSHVDIAMEPY